jgi:hypothetical protein
VAVRRVLYRYIAPASVELNLSLYHLIQPPIIAFSWSPLATFNSTTTLSIPSFVFHFARRTFSIIFHTHDSNICSLFSSFLLMIHVSALNNATLHNEFLTNLLFAFLLNFLVIRFLLFKKDSFASAIIFLISVLTVADVRLKGEILEQVESFTYHRGTITWDGRSISDIKCWIVQAKTALMAKRPLLCTKCIRLETRKQYVKVLELVKELAWNRTEWRVAVYQS